MAWLEVKNGPRDQGGCTGGTITFQYPARYVDVLGNASIAYYTGTWDPATNTIKDAITSGAMFLLGAAEGDPVPPRIYIIEELEFSDGTTRRQEFWARPIATDASGLEWDYTVPIGTYDVLSGPVVQANFQQLVEVTGQAESVIDSAETAISDAQTATTNAQNATAAATAKLDEMQEISNAVGNLNPNTESLAWAVVDDANRPALGVKEDGTLYPAKLANLPESTTDGDNLTLDATVYHNGWQPLPPNNLGLAYAVMDSNKRVVMGAKEDGTPYLPGLVIEEPSAPNNLVVYLGDSITRGKYGVLAGGDTETEADKWTYKLATARGWTYSNKGIDGSCVASGFLYSMYDRHTADVIAQNPGRVTIWGGTNDWANNVPIGSIGTLTATTFAGAYRMMAESILTNTSALVYFITPLVRDPAAGPSEYAANRAEQSPNTAGFTLDEYRQVVRDVARLMARLYPGRAFLIDAGRELEAPFRYRRSTLMDVTQFHPNPSGMELLYRHFDTYIK